MVTKSKAPSAQPAPKAHNPLHDEFGKGVKLFEQGKRAEAAKVMEGVAAKARETGEVHLLRSAQTYQGLCAEEAHAKSVSLPADFEAQLELNRKDPKAAITALDKALKAQPKDAKLHYLKAVALAQLDQEEESAASLKAAVELDPSLAYVFRLEPDFEEMRGSTAFSFTHGK
jgi:tetratricopeptide (TPR) repeat protein